MKLFGMSPVDARMAINIRLCNPLFDNLFKLDVSIPASRSNLLL